jgi:hypothetical protein
VSVKWRNKRRKHGMNARQKLNLAYINGAVVISGVVGLLAGSWGVFCLALIVLVVIHLGSGGIRPERRN